VSKEEEKNISTEKVHLTTFIKSILCLTVVLLGGGRTLQRVIEEESRPYYIS
jgi:hypothetical protein